MTNKMFLSHLNLTRLLVALLVVLSLIAGYYQQRWLQEQKRYLRLEDMYVRLRGELGVEETQRLIDQSYLKTE